MCESRTACVLPALCVVLRFAANNAAAQNLPLGAIRQAMYLAAELADLVISEDMEDHIQQMAQEALDAAAAVAKRQHAA